MHVIPRETVQGSVFYLWDQCERVGGKTQVNKSEDKQVFEGTHQPCYK